MGGWWSWVANPPWVVQKCFPKESRLEQSLEKPWESARTQVVPTPRSKARDSE